MHTSCQDYELTEKYTKPILKIVTVVAKTYAKEFLKKYITMVKNKIRYICLHKTQNSEKQQKPQIC